MTCALMIHRCWKEPQTPTLNMWRVQMMETAACMKLLGKLNRTETDGLVWYICNCCPPHYCNQITSFLISTSVRIPASDYRFSLSSYLLSDVGYSC